MYAQYNKRKAELEALGITEDILKVGILKRYKVDSRAELTKSQYVAVRTALTDKFPKWVTDLAPKQDATEKSTEKGESPSSEGDQPF